MKVRGGLEADMAITTTDAEAVQTAVFDYLERVGRSGDRAQMAERVALEHSLGARLLGFRRRGREVLLYDETMTPSEIVIYEVDVDGTLLRVGTAGRGVAIDRWMREHRHYLEWVGPEWG